MLISEKIRQVLPEIELEVINEKSVKTLGFFDCAEKSVCCFVGGEKFISKIPQNADTLIVSPSLKDKLISYDKGLIIVDEPQKVFWTLHQMLSQDSEYIRPAFDSVISNKAIIGEYVSISPNNVIIEDNVVIEDFVTVYENTHIKKNSIVRSGCRIGGVGFQEYRTDEQIITINHYGGVVIEEDVDIQNNSCVDRGLFPSDDTIIGAETKIDNMVHIAHATRIGSSCELAANAVIAGRCIVGNNVWIGLGALIRNFVEIGNDSRVNIGSVVVRNVPEGGSVSGNYAINHELFMYEQLLRSRMK